MSENMPGSAVKPTIRDMKRTFSPIANPFLESTTLEMRDSTKRRYVRTATSQQLVDPVTGEFKAVSMIHTVEECDDAHFVKVFTAGVKAAFALGATAAKVFQAVLESYQAEKMTGGYADAVNLMWFDDGLNGHAIDMSERTFNRGLRELLEKDFIRPKMPNVYWVNPALFFKGDRVAFVKEYRRRGADSKAVADKRKPDLPARKSED